MGVFLLATENTEGHGIQPSVLFRVLRGKKSKFNPLAIAAVEFCADYADFSDCRGGFVPITSE